MDVEEFLNVKRMTEGTMAERRKNLKKEIIRQNLVDCPSTFTNSNIKSACEKEADLSFGNEFIDDTLMEFEGVYIKRTNDQQYELIKEPDFDDFEVLIEPVWKEFTTFLELVKEGEVDPYYKSSRAGLQIFHEGVPIRNHGIGGGTK